MNRRGLLRLLGLAPVAAPMALAAAQSSALALTATRVRFARIGAALRLGDLSSLTDADLRDHSQGFDPLLGELSMTNPRLLDPTLRRTWVGPRDGDEGGAASSEFAPIGPELDRDDAPEPSFLALYGLKHEAAPEVRS